MTFDIHNVPTKPRSIAMKLLRLKFLDGVHLETVKKVILQFRWDISAFVVYA